MNQDVTPEGMKVEGGGGLPQQGVRRAGSEAVGHDRGGGQDLIINFALYGSGFEVGEARGYNRNVDVAGSRDQLVEAHAGVAGIPDAAGSGMDFDHRTGYVLQNNITAGGGYIDVTLGHLAKGDRSAQSFHVDVSVADQVCIDRGGGAFEDEVSFEVLGRQRASGSTQNDAGVSRDQHLVVDVVRLGARGNLRAGGQFNAALALLGLNLDGIGVA